ncbi:MAG: metal-dependent hydrolase [archaeon]
MPKAVVHILLAIIVLDLFRDYVVKDKKAMPLHVLLIGGIAGLLPDFDIPLYWLVKNVLGYDVALFHRTFTHSLFFPLIFVGLGLLLYFYNKKAAMITAVVAFGVAFHIFLDASLTGYTMLLYPFSTQYFGFDVLGNVTWISFVDGLDAIILVLWLAHEEMRHKISDFI